MNFSLLTKPIFKISDSLDEGPFKLINSTYFLYSESSIIKCINIKTNKNAFSIEEEYFMEPYFGGDVITCINTLLNRGLSVVCCGLDLNWKNEPFDIISKLRTIADRYTVLHAKCAVCGEPAIYTYKRGGSESNIELGAADIYEPRCARHYPFSPIYEPDDDNQDASDLKQGDLFEN